MEPIVDHESLPQKARKAWGNGSNTKPLPEPYMLAYVVTWPQWIKHDDFWGKIMAMEERIPGPQTIYNFCGVGACLKPDNLVR